MPSDVILPALFGATVPTCAFGLQKLWCDYRAKLSARSSASTDAQRGAIVANGVVAKEGKLPPQPQLAAQVTEVERKCCLSILQDQEWGNDQEWVWVFSDVTTVIETILEAPIVVISLVVEDETWNRAFHSRSRLGQGSVQNSTICAWTFHKDSESYKHRSPMIRVIKDASTDQRYANSPLVTSDPYTRFYVGSPLITSDGHRIGALCLLDRHSRRISRGQQQLVINFAEIVIRQLEKYRLRHNLMNLQANHDPEVAPEPHGAEPRKHGHTYSSSVSSADFVAGTLREERMKDSLSEALLLVQMRSDDLHWPLLYANEEWHLMTNIEVRPPKGSSFRNSGDNHLLGLGPLGRCDDSPPKEFWDVLRPPESGADSDDKKSALKQYSRFIEDGVSFGLTAVTRSEPRIVFRVRCQPADKPLDAAAEAVRTSTIHGVKDDTSGRKTRRMYFAILVEASPCSGHPSSQKFENMAGDSSSSHSSLRNIFESQSSKTSTYNTNPDDSGSLTSCDGGMSAPGIGKSMNSIRHIKPASSPFMDVRLVKQIGTGAFAKVWYGLWIGQPVAVKVMKWTGNANMMNGRPVFEGALSAELSHPNLVQTYKHSTMKVEDELEESDSLADMEGLGFKGLSGAQKGLASSDSPRQEEFETWITQEWCEMGTLMDYCQNSPPMKHGGFPEVLGICVDITSGVTYMHSRGIIHGDLTANNVLLVCRPASLKGFMCKVSDFGLSRVLEGDDESIQTQQLGTVTHMPPELFKTSGCSLSKSADIYGIGVLMWQVFHGTIPFEELTPPQVIVQVAQGLRLKISTESPAGFAQIFYGCTATDPNERPPGEQALQSLLECGGYPSQAIEPVGSGKESDSSSP